MNSTTAAIKDAQSIGPKLWTSVVVATATSILLLWTAGFLPPG